MSTWLNAPDASGLWWVRREDHRDVVLQVDVGDDGVWINRGGEGWCSAAEYDGARWCRVVTPERVEALESALREVIEAHRSRMDPDDDNWCRRCGAHWIREAHGHGCPVGRALSVLRGATVAGEGEAGTQGRGAAGGVAMPSDERQSEIAALERELRTVGDQIDAAFWCFTRQARAKPPVLAVPKAYERRDEINERLKALRTGEGSHG